MTRELHPDKTGQGIDLQKRELLAPLLAQEILYYRRETGVFAPTIIDFGSGDGASVIHAAEDLYMNSARPVGSIIRVDIDGKIIGPLVASSVHATLPEATSFWSYVGSNRETMELLERDGLHRIDICYAQLSMHQILRNSELSLAITRLMKLMKDGGVMLVSDLHPEFLDYLLEYEPEKFVLDLESGVGQYHFDSGGSAMVKHRDIREEVAEIAVGLGFVESGITRILPQGISVDKERYRIMVDRGIPLFYMLRMKFDLSRVKSLEEGTIESVDNSDGYMRIVFENGDEIHIPFPGDNRPKMNSGDILTLSEVDVPERGKRYLNLWVERVGGDMVEDVGWWRIVSEYAGEENR